MHAKKELISTECNKFFYNVGYAAGLNFAIEKSFSDMEIQMETAKLLHDDNSVIVSDTIDKIKLLLEEQRKHFEQAMMECNETKPKEEDE